MIPMRAFYVFLAVAGFLIAMFIYAAWSTRRARDLDNHGAYSLRKKLLFIVLAVLVIGLAVTLAKTPYPRESDIPAQVVFVVAEVRIVGSRPTIIMTRSRSVPTITANAGC